MSLVFQMEIDTQTSLIVEVVNNSVPRDHLQIGTRKGRMIIGFKLKYLKSGIHGALAQGVPLSIIRERAVAYFYYWLQLYGNHPVGLENTIRALANVCEFTIFEFVKECCELNPRKSLSELMSGWKDAN